MRFSIDSEMSYNSHKSYHYTPFYCPILHYKIPYCERFWVHSGMLLQFNHYKKSCSRKRVNTKDKYISTSMTSVFYYCVKKMCIFAFMSDESCTTNSLITLYLLNRIRFLWIILYRKILKKTIEQLRDSLAKVKYNMKIRKFGFFFNNIKIITDSYWGNCYLKFGDYMLPPTLSNSEHDDGTLWLMATLL